MKELRTRRISITLTEEKYSRMQEIAKTEDRKLANLAGWWCQNCAREYDEVDERGWAYIKIRLLHKCQKLVRRPPPDIMRGQLKLERGGTA